MANNMDLGRPKGLGIERFAWELGNANKRLFVALMFCIVALIGTNLAWTVYFTQYSAEVVTIEAEQEADGLGRNYIIGGDYGNEAEGEDN